MLISIIFFITLQLSKPYKISLIQEDSLPIDCIVEISTNHFKYSYPSLLTVLVGDSNPDLQDKVLKNLNLSSKWFIEVIKTHRMEFESFTQESGLNQFNPDFKTKYYVLISDTFEEFLYELEVLATIRSFNARANCVVYFSGCKEDYERISNMVLTKLWQYKLYRAVVLIASNVFCDSDEDSIKGGKAIIRDNVYNDKVGSNGRLSVNEKRVPGINERMNTIDNNLYSDHSNTNDDTVFKVFTLNIFETRKVNSSSHQIDLNKCTSNPKLLEISQCTKLQKDSLKIDIFYASVPKDLLNCTIDLISMKYPPNIIDESTGVEIELIKTIQKAMNISWRFSIQTTAKNWGERINGSWTGKLGTILEEDAVGIGNFQASEVMYDDFSFSRDYIQDKLVWIVPKADQIPRWKSIFIVFQLKIWLTILFTYILGTVFLYLLSKNRKELKTFRRTGRILILSLQNFIGNSTNIVPITLMMRSVVLSILFFNIVGTSLYTSSLINALTNVIYQHQINSEQDIVENLNIGGFSAYKYIFDSPDETSQIIFNKYQIDENITATNWLKNVANNNFATIASEVFVKYLLSQNNSVVKFDDGLPKIYISKETIYIYPVKMVMPKNFIFLPAFNRIIDKVSTSGLFQKWSSKYMWQLRKSEKLKQSKREVQLTLDHLQGSFVLLFAGCLIGFFCLIAEFGAYEFAKKKKRRRFMRELRKNFVN